MQLNYTDPLRFPVKVNTQQYIDSITIMCQSLGMQCIILDAENKILYDSEAFCNEVGIKSQKLVGKIITNFAMPKLARYSLFKDQVTQQQN